MSPVCAGIRRDGGRCTATVAPGATYCANHDPARAEQRKRAARRAGKRRWSTPTRDVEATRDQLQHIADRVLGGELEPAYAYAAVAALNGKLRSLDLLRRWHESDELERELQEIRELVGYAERGA